MADYTIEEQKAIAKLRVRMQNELPKEFYEDELFLYKFLKARNFNLKQTESMIIKHLNFRKFTQLDTILRDYKPREVLEKYVRQTVVGFSREGCPISYIPMGTIDGPGLFKSMNANGVLKDVLVRLELDKEIHKRQTKKLGKLVSQSIFIYNMEKFSIFQATHKSSIQMFMRGVQTFQDNYPEMLKTVYIINAHIYSTWAFAMVKTIMASGLLDKIKIFGKTGWKEELLEEIDANELPAFLGGNKTDPDGNPLCLSFIPSFLITPTVGSIPKRYITERTLLILRKLKNT